MSLSSPPQEVWPPGHCTKLDHSSPPILRFAYCLRAVLVNMTYLVNHQSGQWFGIIDRTSPRRQSSRDEASLTQNTQVLNSTTTDHKENLELYMTLGKMLPFGDRSCPSSRTRCHVCSILPGHHRHIVVHFWPSAVRPHSLASTVFEKNGHFRSRKYISWHRHGFACLLSSYGRWSTSYRQSQLIQNDNHNYFRGFTDR